MCDGAERPVVVPDAQINRIQILQFEFAVARGSGASVIRRQPTAFAIDGPHWHVKERG